MITADVLVLGGGTAGCVAAGEAARAGLDVVLVEAGPDFGARSDGGWPDGLLEPWTLPTGYDWGLAETTADGRTLALDRGRVVGGSSAVNGCVACWGARADYDAWAAAGLTDWSADVVRAELAEVSDRLRVRTPKPGEVTPFQSACLHAAVERGFVLLDDVNDLDSDEGVGTVPSTTYGGFRYNAAFAFLYDVREAGLRVLADRLVDRLEVRGGRVTGVHLVGPHGRETASADLVVLAAGTYGSPGILLRSGIGPVDALAAIGVAPVLAVPGVGANLHDHPTAEVRFAGSPELERAMAGWLGDRGVAEEPVLVKARSSRAVDAFDLHVFPVSETPLEGREWGWVLPVACLTPRSRGTVRLSSADPEAAPVIRHGFLTDEDQHDRRVLLDGIDLVRGLAAAPSLRDLLGEELSPCLNGADLAAWVSTSYRHYWHPVGTCRMAPDADADGVTAQDGRVRGLANCLVLDASVLPTAPRANTNLPTAAVARKLIRGALVR